MTLGFLQEKQSERVFSTAGSEFTMFPLDLKNKKLARSPEFRQLQLCAQRVFSVSKLNKMEPLIVWHDNMEGLGTESDFYTDWAGCFVLGTFFSEDAYGEDYISHLFIRNLQGFRGPLDEWNSDITYPPGVKHYSVCIVLAPGFMANQRAREDPHNYLVTRYPYEDMLKVGVDFNILQKLVLRDD